MTDDWSCAFADVAAAASRSTASHLRTLERSPRHWSELESCLGAGAESLQRIGESPSPRLSVAPADMTYLAFRSDSYVEGKYGGLLGGGDA